MEEFKLYDSIVCIDLKCFFASVECRKRNLDPDKALLVVADQSRGDSSIILAVSPALRKLGIPGRCRIFELPTHLRKHIIFAKPMMADYVDISNHILKMYLQYFSRDDILVYSIDEVFIDLTSYLTLYQYDAYEIVTFLLDELQNNFYMQACAGIGDNMLLAKLALDIEAKHNHDFIASWTYDDLPNKLWPITDMREMWGIGPGLEKKLHKIGIRSIGEIANFDIYKLVDYLGMAGEELYLHTHGIDVSKINEQERHTKRKGYSMGQTLFHNTPKKEARQYVKDLVLQLTHRLRIENKAAQVVKLSIRYATDENQPSFGMQHKLEHPTFNSNLITKEIMELYDNHVEDLKIRKIGLYFNKISDFEGVQLNLFDQGNQYENNAELDMAYDYINAKFGNHTVMKASALTKESNLLERSALIGGHNAK